MAARLAAILLALSACGSDGGPDGGVGGTGGNPTLGECHNGCSQIEVVCPARWDAIGACVDECLAEPYAPFALLCVGRATSCGQVDVCLSAGAGPGT